MCAVPCVVVVSGVAVVDLAVVDLVVVDLVVVGLAVVDLVVVDLVVVGSAVVELAAVGVVVLVVVVVGLVVGLGVIGLDMVGLGAIGLGTIGLAVVGLVVVSLAVVGLAVVALVLITVGLAVIGLAVVVTDGPEARGEHNQGKRRKRSLQQWIEIISQEQSTNTHTHTCYFQLQLLSKYAVAPNLAAEIVGAYRRRFEGVGRRGRQFFRFREITFVECSFIRELPHVVIFTPFKYNLSGCFAIRFHNHALFSCRHPQFPIDGLSRGGCWLECGWLSCGCGNGRLLCGWFGCRRGGRGRGDWCYEKQNVRAT